MTRRPGRLGVRERIFLLLAALVGITLAGGAVMIWYTARMETLFETVVDRDVDALEQAEELEIALVKQRGLVSYYFINGDAQWLTQLDEYRHEFQTRFQKVRELTGPGPERELLDQVETQYQSYVETKDRVIALYQAGEREKGAQLHEQTRIHFFKILELCSQFRDAYKIRIQAGLARNQAQAKRYRLVAGTAMSAALALGALLALVLVSELLDPIRKLARETATEAEKPAGGNDLAALSDRVHGLIENVDQTRLELERSREMLFQSEKMAMMGKLAADMAHSIRNPLTSIKMRLFSLERSLELSSAQKEDLEVVSEEMRHLDNIVRNFLEFSRPPKLMKQRVDVSEIFDMTFKLLDRQIEKSGVAVEWPSRNLLPEIEADPELLKEVLVNLIVNALDAMPGGGRIRVSGDEAAAPGIGRAVMIRISDTGPGIPESIRDRIFEPFFSTKEEGTGLGLPIALRIIREHGGSLDLKSEEGAGTAFIITLPVKETP